MPQLASPLVEIIVARALAMSAHYGQTTKSENLPYVTHLEAVAAQVPDEYKPVAWLHDILEDTPMTDVQLRAAGISEPTITAVKLLTRKSKVLVVQLYGEYIDSIIESQNIAALVVKRADLTHNLRPSCPEPLAARYRLALPRVAAALDRLGFVA